jgi:hypothetical protein
LTTKWFVENWQQKVPPKLKIVLIIGEILATCLLKHKPKITQEFFLKKQDKVALWASQRQLCMPRVSL